MRPRVLIWILAGTAAATLARTGDDGAEGAAPDPPAAPSTSPAATSPPAPATTFAAAPPTPATTSTTIAATSSPTTASSPATTLAASNGYRWVPKPAVGPGIVGPGGALTKNLAADIATAFQLDLANVEAAIAAVELPPEAGGNPEGWLAPGCYELPAGASAGDLVQAMVDRRVAQLERRNVPRDAWPRVARVLAKRLEGGGPLQMGSIILYPVPHDRIFTTAEERAADDPYNSYRQDGLPPTPISSPDEASLDAFLDPAPGDWWFYVTVDLHSGDTRYAVTYEEHQRNVELLRSWLADNPTP